MNSSDGKDTIINRIRRAATAVPSTPRTLLLLALTGLTLIALAWLNGEDQFESALFLELGAAVTLFAGLFFVERKLETRISELRDELQDEKMAVRAMRSLGRNLVRQEFETVEAMLSSLAEEVSYDVVYALLRHVQHTGAVSVDGPRVEIFGPGESWFIRVRAHEEPHSERVVFRFETASAQELGSFDWHSGQTPAELTTGLFRSMKASGLRWIDYDPAWIVERLLEVLNLSVRSSYGIPGFPDDLGPVIELPHPQWAVTERGLESTDPIHRYLIDWWRLWETSVNWEDHVPGKGWVDDSGFLSALWNARDLFASLKDTAAAEAEKHRPPLD